MPAPWRVELEAAAREELEARFEQTRDAEARLRRTCLARCLSDAGPEVLVITAIETFGG